MHWLLLLHVSETYPRATARRAPNRQGEAIRGEKGEGAESDSVEDLRSLPDPWGMVRRSLWRIEGEVARLALCAGLVTPHSAFERRSPSGLIKRRETYGLASVTVGRP